RLLRNIDEYFPALEREIDAAASEIFLETYIFEADDTGQRVAAALIRAARRGVLVHLMIDGFGSRLFPEEQRRELLEAGVQLLVFRPELWSLKFRSTRLRRLHRKLAVLDGRIGFCGGINIIDHGESRRNAPRRRVAISAPPSWCGTTCAIATTSRKPTCARSRGRIGKSWLRVPIFCPAV